MVNAWFVPRFTNDVDFLVVPSAQLISRFEEAASALGYDYERRQDEGGASGPDFLRMVDSQGNAFDIQTAKTDYQMLVLERAVRSEPEGVLVATPEDLLILKLIANRSKDRGDLLNLVARNGLDWQYIDQWAEIWDVTERLRAIRLLAD